MLIMSLKARSTLRDVLGQFVMACNSHTEIIVTSIFFSY